MLLFSKLLLTSSIVLFASSNYIVHQQLAHNESVLLTINGNETCTGTAIGPHAILTAAHCIDQTYKTLVIHGEKVTLLYFKKDGYDHIILITDMKFQHWAKISKVQPKIGDDIYVWGNPGDYHDLLRKGIVSGFTDANKTTTATVYDFNGFFGDSGSAVFNDNGDIVGVISFVIAQQHEGIQWKMMASIPLHFSDETIKQAESY